MRSSLVASFFSFPCFFWDRGGFGHHLFSFVIFLECSPPSNLREVLDHDHDVLDHNLLDHDLLDHDLLDHDLVNCFESVIDETKEKSWKSAKEKEDHAPKLIVT